MICKPCCDGGDLTRAARLGTPTDVNRRNMLALAAQMHGECRGHTWCDCGHAPPRLLRASVAAV